MRYKENLQSGLDDAIKNNDGYMANFYGQDLQKLNELEYYSEKRRRQFHEKLKELEIECEEKTKWRFNEFTINKPIIVKESLYDKILRYIAIIGFILILYSIFDHFNRYDDYTFKHPTQEKHKK